MNKNKKFTFRRKLEITHKKKNGIITVDIQGYECGECGRPLEINEEYCNGTCFESSIR